MFNSEKAAPFGAVGPLVPLIISVAVAAALALTLVWLNIERTKFKYKDRTLQMDLRKVQDLNAKLVVEREHLLSPRELDRKAAKLGLRPAKPGQIRRIPVAARPPAHEEGTGTIPGALTGTTGSAAQGAAEQ